MEEKSKPPLLDMTADGEFRTPSKPPLAARIAAVAMIVAVAAGALAVAALAIWVAALLIPVVLVATLIAYLALRFRMRKGSFGRPGNIFRVDIFRS